VKALILFIPGFIALFFIVIFLIFGVPFG